MAGKEINLLNQSGYKNQPKWTIAARQPQRELGKGMPGPGAYGQTHTEKDKFRSSSAFSIAGGRGDGKEWATMPGPGQYAAKIHGKTMPSFGFGSAARLSEVKQNRGPGPGSYEVRGNLEGLHFSVSSRPEGTNKHCKSPGPGQYKPSYDQIYDSAPKSSFGSGTRSELALSKSPGPGQYEALPVLGGSCGIRSMPRYTIAGKRSSPGTDQTPGPGPTATQFAR
jgi:hypothetical protein